MRRFGLQLLVWSICLGASPSALAEGPAPTDPAPGGLGLAETAFMRPPGSFAWTSVDVGVQHFEWGMTPYLTAYASAAVPVPLIAGRLGIRLGTTLAPCLHVSMTVEGGTAYEVISKTMLVAGGGGPALTWGTPDLHLTVKARVWFGSFLEERFGRWLVVPTVGGGARLAEMVVVYAHVGPVFSGTMDADWLTGDAWLAQYGVRVHNDRWHVGIGFLLPIHPDYWDALPFLPLGLPMATLGLGI